MENVKFKPLVQELMDMARHLRAASSQDYDEQYKALQQRLYQELEAADKRERTLRRLLAVTYAGSTLYTDDGELSDSRQHPGIDFKRMDPMFIEAAMRERSMHQWESLCAKDTVLGRWAASGASFKNITPEVQAEFDRLTPQFKALAEVDLHIRMIECETPQDEWHASVVKVLTALRADLCKHFDMLPPSSFEVNAS